MNTIDKVVFSKYPIDHYGEIWEKLTIINFDKKTVLPKDVLCFLQKGTIRKSFTECIEDDGISIDFYFEGDIFTTKYEADNPSNYEPISTGILGYVEMTVVKQLFLESKLCSTTQRVFLEERLREKTIREMQLLRSTPKEMYLHLLKSKPHFIQNVPLKYLASYIGITPQALSRIRKHIN